MAHAPGTIMLGQDGRRLLHPDGSLMVHADGADPCCGGDIDPCPHCDDTPACLNVRLSGFDQEFCHSSGNACYQPVKQQAYGIDGDYTLHSSGVCSWALQIDDPNAGTRATMYDNPAGDGCRGDVTDTAEGPFSSLTISVNFGPDNVSVSMATDTDWIPDNHVLPAFQAMAQTAPCPPIVAFSNSQNTQMYGDCSSPPEPWNPPLLPIPGKVVITHNPECAPPDVQEPPEPPTNVSDGACCFECGPCQQMTAQECANAGGTFLGRQTSCSDCPERSGACCLPNGDCVYTTQSLCEAAGGAYTADCVTCDDVICPPAAGVCCGKCICNDGANEEDCNASGGVWVVTPNGCSDDPCGIASDPDCWEYQEPPQPPRPPSPPSSPASAPCDGCNGDTTSPRVSLRAVAGGAYSMAAQRLGVVKSRDKGERERVLAICMVCGQFNRVRDGFCGKPGAPIKGESCGCLISEKIKAANQVCPQGKW